MPTFKRSEDKFDYWGRLKPAGSMVVGFWRWHTRMGFGAN